MKISFNKAVVLVVIAVLIVCICIAIIFVVNSNTNKNVNNASQQLTSSSSNSSYDGTEELGTPVEFEIQEVELPEKVGDEESAEVNGNTWFYDLDAQGNAINIYTYDTFTGDVTLPDTLNGHKVISIGSDNAAGTDNTLFHAPLGGEDYWDNITSITVPDGVQYINEYAFMGYDKLERVTLPDTVIYIGDDAFTSSTNLAYINSDIEGKVVMPKGLQYYGESLFRYNDKINDFEFPEQINYIQDWTFYETSGFSDVTISGQFEYVGQGAFSSSEVKTLTIEDGVKIIKASAFNMNKQLTSVNMADSVTVIEKNAFSLCSLLNEFHYNGKLSYIGKGVFDYTNVKDVLESNQLP